MGSQDRGQLADIFYQYNNTKRKPRQVSTGGHFLSVQQHNGKPRQRSTGRHFPPVQQHKGEAKTGVNWRTFSISTTTQRGNQDRCQLVDIFYQYNNTKRKPRQVSTGGHFLSVQQHNGETKTEVNWQTFSTSTTAQRGSQDRCQLADIFCQYHKTKGKPRQMSTGRHFLSVPQHKLESQERCQLADICYQYHNTKGKPRQMSTGRHFLSVPQHKWEAKTEVNWRSFSISTTTQRGSQDRCHLADICYQYHNTNGKPRQRSTGRHFLSVPQHKVEAKTEVNWRTFSISTTTQMGSQDRCQLVDIFYQYHNTKGKPRQRSTGGHFLPVQQHKEEAKTGVNWRTFSISTTTQRGNQDRGQLADIFYQYNSTKGKPRQVSTGGHFLSVQQHNGETKTEVNWRIFSTSTTTQRGSQVRCQLADIFYQYNNTRGNQDRGQLADIFYQYNNTKRKPRQVSTGGHYLSVQQHKEEAKTGVNWRTLSISTTTQRGSQDRCQLADIIYQYNNTKRKPRQVSTGGHFLSVQQHNREAKTDVNWRTLSTSTTTQRGSQDRCQLADIIYQYNSTKGKPRQVSTGGHYLSVQQHKEEAKTGVNWRTFSISTTTQQGSQDRCQLADIFYQYHNTTGKPRQRSTGRHFLPVQQHK